MNTWLIDTALFKSLAVGDAVTISAGDAWLMEGTTGSGHTTEVISQGPFEAVVIQLPDDVRLARH